MDFNKMPKLLADAWHLNNNRDWFFIGFSSGEQNSTFLLPPMAMKGFAAELDKRIKKYEADFGTIDMTGYQTGIQSPFQPK